MRPIANDGALRRWDKSRFAAAYNTNKSPAVSASWSTPISTRGSTSSRGRTRSIAARTRIDHGVRVGGGVVRRLAGRARDGTLARLLRVVPMSALSAIPRSTRREQRQQLRPGLGDVARTQ